MRQGIVIVGGGLAGASAALRLAAAGRKVLLLEKSRGLHNKVCGEFLSTEALYYLHSQGIDPEALGAKPLQQLRLASGNSLTEAYLPFSALSLSRACLDEALLQAAMTAGVEVRRGVHVDRLQQQDSRWQIGLRDGAPLQAETVFLATGKHDLRDLPRPPGRHDGLVGFKMYFCLSPEQTAALTGAVELALFTGGYAGLQPVEGGRANLCLLVESRALRASGGNWPALLTHIQRHAPHLATRLAGAVPLLPAPLTVASVPYGHIQATTEPGLWRLGDQAAVIPSFSGDGMSIALHSAALAVDHYLRGRSSASFQRELAGQMRGRLRLATELSRLLVRHPWAAHLGHMFPALLPGIASVTRIPYRYLLREAEA